MFNWVVKVVPQPPEIPGNLGEEEKPNPPPSAPEKKACFKDEERKETKPKQEKPKEEELSEESSSQSGMLNWISNGFANALPQPAGSPRLSRANSDVKDEGAGDTRQGNGVIGWIVQGLGKVVPQPEEKYKEGSEPEEDTEVQDVQDVPDSDPLQHIPVVEVESEDEICEVQENIQPFPPKVIDWIKHSLEKIVPQPAEIQAPLQSEAPLKKETSESVKVTSPPPESPKPAEETKAPNVMGWIVQGLGRMMPQPVLRPKEDTQEGADVVQNVCICQEPVDMVLEEVDSDWEAEKQQQPQTPNVQLNAQPQVLAMQQKDADIQAEQSTQPMGNNTGEPEDSAEDTVEESLSQDGVEEAKTAEELTRQAVEMAVSQLKEEQAAKLAEGANHKAINGEQLPSIKEEENEEYSESLVDVGPEEGVLNTPQMEPKAEEKLVVVSAASQLISQKEISPEPVRALTTLPKEPKQPESTPIGPEPPSRQITVEVAKQPASETVKTPPSAKSTEPEKTVKRDSLAQVSTQLAKAETPVVTTQPGPSKDACPPPAAEEDETADEGCGVPTNCIAVKNWLMRIPHTSECLDRFNVMLQENNITLPKLPAKPQLAHITQHLPQLPPQLSKLPQQAQKCYHNVLNHINSLKPQQDA